MVGDPGKIEQWCLRVPAADGELHRQILIRNGTLDRTLKPRRDGDTLLLPITAWRKGAERSVFTAHPDRPALPRHEVIGGIAIMQEPDAAGAGQILASRPNLHTVLSATSEVEGEYRTKSFVVLAGIPTTRTTLIEHGLRFTVDLSAAYFSARLATERRRIASAVTGGETILDMFAGVGPFAIALARKAAVVVAADINPQAVQMMLLNCEHNRVRNVLPLFADSRHISELIPWKFDRIVMNLPKSGEEFLPDAFRLCKPGGSIHLYALVSTEGEHQARIQDQGGIVVDERVVRSYSPNRWHVVYDIKKKG